MEMAGRLVFDFIPSGSVATGTGSLPCDRSAKRNSLEATGASAVCSGIIANSGGTVLGRYKSLGGVFSGDRYYFGPQIDPDIVFRSNEDFTISALAVSYFGAGNRAFFVGTPISGGGNGTIAMGILSGGARQISLAPGTGTGPSLSWTGPTVVTNTIMRYDLCRVNGMVFAFFDGKAATGGSANGTADTGTHIQGGKLSIGGVGEYTGGGSGGSYGERWSGTVEKFVFLKGIGLYTAAFDPNDRRPFTWGRVRR